LEYFLSCWEYVGKIKRKPLNLLEIRGLFLVARAGLETLFYDLLIFLDFIAVNITHF